MPVSNLPRLLSAIRAPAGDVAAEARRHVDALTKPPGSLGRLEDLAVRLAMLRGGAPSVDAPVIFTFAGGDGGADLVGTGEMGIGNTTAASAITSALTGAPVEQVTGRGTGIDDATLARKIDAISRALDVNRPDPGDPIDVLAKVGGFEIAGLVGVV